MWVVLWKPEPGWTWGSHTPKALFLLGVGAGADLPVVRCQFFRPPPPEVLGNSCAGKF